MNYQRYTNDEMQWKRINQCPGSSFPNDWDDDNDEGYGYNDAESFGNYYGFNNKNNRYENKCYYGKIFFCEKDNRNDDYNNDKYVCNKKGHKNYDDDKREDNRNYDKKENHNNRKCCCPRCCLCNFFKNFHC